LAVVRWIVRQVSLPVANRVHHVNLPIPVFI